MVQQGIKFSRHLYWLHLNLVGSLIYQSSLVCWTYQPIARSVVCRFMKQVLRLR
ncbi:hypothetical protein GO730_15975 [Spirosoma sp. HMF3257]|uniref:hypothetical protein n=1 Tax=Spirosoma telluris TaxID=2183553 RepID=UPI0012FAB8A2|nr:hypothetical protein [Spirosoma telluris]